MSSWSAEHAKTWFTFAQGYSKVVLSKLDAARDAPELITVNACPVRAIREVKENGEEIYLGDVGIDRCMDGKLLALSAGAQADDEQAARYQEENCGRSAGDPKIIWDFGGTLGNSSSTLFVCVESFVHGARLPQAKPPWSGNHD